MHSFSEAVEAGLAPDGGLFLPESFPDISTKLETWANLTYPELAAEFFQHFAPEIPADEWKSLTQQAYAKFDHPEVAPLRKLDDQTFVLELFHGPTLAFKDFALQLLGLLYKRQVSHSKKKLAILGATSGDTGSAAIHGCMGQDGIDIFILYPNGRVAPLQERQMACTGASNVFALPIPGTFDDAQALVKDAFADTAFAKSQNLSAVNSINIARILAQCVYYIWAYLQWKKQAKDSTQTLEFVVPTGNFGNILAGWLASKMGLPVKNFCVATNHNDILYRFFTEGKYVQGEVKPSYAPSMDIQAASNFERFLYFLVEEDSSKVREIMAAIKAGQSPALPSAAAYFSSTRTVDDEIPGVIARIHQTYGYTVDPHTACGFASQTPNTVKVILSTASPAKFPEVVEQATGVEPLHPTLEDLKSKDLQTHPLPADLSQLKDFISAHHQV